MAAKTSRTARASAKRTTSVAFLGLGAMGKPMAARLVARGFSVRTYNRTPDAAKTLSGATAHATARECAHGADVVITMLSDGEALASVLEGEDGVLAAFAEARRKPLLVDMSTIGRAAALVAAARVKAHGGSFVDAPVSGSVAPATRGELVALAGGSVRHVERARTVLDVLCKKVIHAGGNGQGQALKVVLNAIGAHHFVALASMLVLSERAGLARDIVLDAVTSGAFATPSYVQKRDKLLARDMTPEFTLTLAEKDIGLAIELLRDVDLELPVTRAIAGEITAAVREGFGALDLYGIERHFAR